LTLVRRVVVAGPTIGAGHEIVVACIADHLRRHPSGRFRVATIDLLERCAPRAARLAAMAYRSGEAFFPDGTGSLAELAAASPGDPLLRELVTGGIASAEAALKALEPDLVLSVHDVTGGIAAEVSRRCGVVSATVVTDLRPERLWAHPDTSAWFTAGHEARDALLARGIAWDRIAVTGVPVPEPAPPGDAGRTRAMEAGGATGSVLVAMDDGAAMVDALVAQGTHVLVRAGDGRPRHRSSPRVTEVSAEKSLGSQAASCDLVVCRPCRSLLWEGPASGTPLIVVEPVSASERRDVDLLVTAGAALTARDADDVAWRVGYLFADASRLERMCAAAAGMGRPAAVRAVVERIAAALR
jgi:UDP-N-acetylglucosamine:LPS N-acetylglucosamine transferase